MAAALTLIGLTACAPVARGPVSAMQGPVAVSLDGRSFAATIQPGPRGTTLTRQGAVGVAGSQIAVTRAGSALRMDEGAVAKRAARQACADAGGRFNAAAIGRYQAAGVWAFPGGCA